LCRLVVAAGRSRVGGRAVAERSGRPSPDLCRPGRYCSRERAAVHRTRGAQPRSDGSAWSRRRRRARSCASSRDHRQPCPMPGAALAQAAPPIVVGRVLTVDECIAIALEAQPLIQATLYDYAAARARVREALAPLLPQLAGTASATQSSSTSTSKGGTKTVST